MKLEETIKSIKPLDGGAMEAARRHWDSIAHPLHSLGRLEDALAEIAGMSGTPDVRLEKKALVVMCADNGVVEEGVTQTGQEVTAIVSENFLKEKATASILCREAGADIFPVDIGIARDTTIINRKIAYGTRNFTKEPAMTRDQAIRALECGIGMAEELKAKGYKILATGEMGIGNTTTSSAVASVLLDRAPIEMTGRGAGLSSEGLKRKIAAIETGIRLHRPDPADPVDVLAKVGGFDIAGMAGVFLGGAALGIPVVMDGFISSVAALAASRIAPAALPYMVASHVSKEPAAHLILEALGKEPFLTCGMCLGEGTGAVALFPLLSMACAVYQSMSTFTENQIEEYKPLA